MSESEDIRALLVEIRDNQKEALRQQAAELSIAQEQLDRARRQVDESLRLQREAIARQKTAMRVAFPGVALCIAAIIYLAVRLLRYL